MLEWKHHAGNTFILAAKKNMSKTTDTDILKPDCFHYQLDSFWFTQ